MPEPVPSLPPTPAPPDKRFAQLSMWPLTLMMVAALWFFQSQHERHPAIDYSDFYARIEAGKVATVTIRGQSLAGTLKEAVAIGKEKSKDFVTVLPPNDGALLPLLRDKGIDVKIESGEQPFAMQLLGAALPWLLILGAWLWLSRRGKQMMTSGGPLASILRSRDRRFDKTRQSNVLFDDVAGLKAAKEDLTEVVAFLKSPEQFQRLGSKIPRGILLVGPPGTGKTLLARAVAGEAGVPFFSMAASEFIELFVGVGASRVRGLFDEAKKNAPAIIFIDEIDAVGRSRGHGLGGGHDEREQTLNQLLSEMDGFNRNDLTIVIAATNRPDVLDAALLRPGRFDRRVLVDRPERDARKAILSVHCKGKPLSDDVDLGAIAETTPGFSGADLANLVNEAALDATRRAAESIAAEDFSAAYDKIVLGSPREGKLDAKEKHRVAVHEAGHALVAFFAPDSEPPHRVSILPRGVSLGATQQTPTADRHLMTEPELQARLSVLLAGYAAERLILGAVSSGAENDLKQATAIASRMVSQLGMSEKLGAVYYDHNTGPSLFGGDMNDVGASEATKQAIEGEARSMLNHALERASALLVERRSELDRLLQALMERETINKAGLVELFTATSAPSAIRPS